MDTPQPVTPALAPSSLGARTIEALEWPRFLKLAQNEAGSEPARERLAHYADPDRWAKTISDATLLQQETTEAWALIDRQGLWEPLNGLLSPEIAFEKLRRGGVLDVAELALIRQWLYALDHWSGLPREEIKGERIKRALQQLPDPFAPLRTLERVLTPTGELSEKASPRLGQLYSDIRSLRKEIQSTLDSVVKNLHQRGVLQEAFTDLRDGRYVVPVKISHQSEVEGILYDSSASKQTVFIEPREISPSNNKLRQKQNELKEEIYIVLKATSEELARDLPDLELGVEILVTWDVIQARARLGRRVGARPIQLTEDHHISLSRTAHPLLWSSLPVEKIIRNDLDFTPPHQTLLLTGPNTGGKTVFLKTIGLAAICARTGFPFPADGTPIVPFFDHIFADLGDPQSIEAHLSSFSGHVLRFKQILEKATTRSLVLLDELNTATDPEEGAALGQAFLQILMDRGSIVVSTTHDPQLKAAALKDSRILNASMTFDESAREPTYRVLLGVVGRSRALETAERLGLGREILDRARSLLSSGHRQLENALADLEHNLEETERARKQAEEMRREAETLKKEWVARTQSSVQEVLERFRQKLRRTLEQAQDEIREQVRKLDDARSRKDVDQARGQINEAFRLAGSRLDSALEEEAPQVAKQIQAETKPTTGNNETPISTDERLTEGALVRIPKWKTTGQIIEIKGDKIRVAMGQLQVQMNDSDVELLSRAERRQIQEQTTRQAQVKKSMAPATTSEYVSAPASQIDLRGKRYEDAMGELGQYLDQAFRSGSYREVTIIHGLGSGALREGCKQLLRRLPYIKASFDAGVGQGGTGATRVEFDL